MGCCYLFLFLFCILHYNKMVRIILNTTSHHMYVMLCYYFVVLQLYPPWEGGEGVVVYYMVQICYYCYCLMMIRHSRCGNERLCHLHVPIFLCLMGPSHGTLSI